MRLRTVLLLGLLLWGLFSLYPRLQAAFGLHDATVAIADYALCMTGPTGPALIRDRPREFAQLVRRRLVAAAPDERPFSRCKKLALSVTAKVEVERTHALMAHEFREYGAGLAPLTALEVSVAPLAELAELAWPFARGGYTKLIAPSLGAVEAAHLPAPARPAVGRGLPARSGAYRNVWREGSGFGLALGLGSELSLHATTDQGLTFRSLARRTESIDQHAERCSSGDGAKVYRLTPREDGEAQLVLFSFGAEPATSSELAPIGERVLALGCDDRSLVALSSDRGHYRLRLCPFGGRCGELRGPPLLTGARGAAIDLAKAKGVIALSVALQGIVRVVSSRDEGRSFTPAIVAFDAAEYPELAMGGRAPTKLLALGDRLLLYAGGSRPNEGYPLLVSDDQGVSFRAP